MRGELLCVDIVAIKEGAVDGIIRWNLVEQRVGFDINDLYASNRAHGGLNNLWIPSINRSCAAVDGIDTKPIGDADNSA